MRGWGIICLIIGIGAFILPSMGRQFVLLSIFGEGQFVVAGILAVLGIVLLAASFMGSSGSKTPEEKKE